MLISRKHYLPNPSQYIKKLQVDSGDRFPAIFNRLPLTFLQ